jgi:hypothetical protein
MKATPDAKTTTVGMIRAAHWRIKLGRTGSQHPLFDDAVRSCGTLPTTDVRRLFTEVEGWPH